MADDVRRLADLSAVKLALLARQARQQLDESGVAAAEPIAVIGMGCRFPGGADDPEKFWRLLASRGDGIREVPADRWSVDALYDPDASAPGKMTTRWGGFLESIDGFDPQFFGISPREAARMDPQQRLLLEVAWEALEDGGQTRAGLDGSATGVFVACYHNDYGRILTADRRDIDAWTSTGTAHSIVANRLSFLLNLRGPSLTVDTACSASLVAVHLACRSLRAEECSLAVVGGVSLMLSPEVTISLSKWGFMAADGRCKTFDAKADGFVRGEGCGVVVLKRLSDALADEDRILGLIRGTAVNQDGRTTVLTAPSGVAQAAVIRQALEDGKVAPDQIDYVEAHGTGTVLGDPIEAEALGGIYGKPVESGHPCVLGAVKANIGHLEAAAGIAGLIKALLCLQHGSIPAQCHFTQLNPHLSLEGSRLLIPTEAMDWARGSRRRLAGVSSFGFGGTNAHIVLEEAPELSVHPASAAASDDVHLLPVSAHRDDALLARAASIRSWLESDHAPIADVCYTAAVRRSHHPHRLAVVGSTAADLAHQLARYLETGDVSHASDRAPRVAFVFAGQGTQRPGMGLELFQSRSEFRAALEECDAAIRARAGWSVIDALREAPSRSQVHRTEIAQPVIFALQVALARLWSSWGVRPDAVCGHSVGEIAAAFVAGALTLDDAARIAVERGRVMEQVTGQGRMVAINLPSSEVGEFLSADLDLAAVNGPRSVVLSGTPQAVEDTARRLTERKVRHHVLPVDYAFHSAQLDSLQETLEQALGAVHPRPARSALFSTVRGRAVDGLEIDARYWATGIRAPVLFARAIDALRDDAETVFVEIGAQPALGAPILECLAARGAGATVVSSLRRDRAELATMLAGLGAVYRSGVDIEWGRLHPAGRRSVALPPYPWQRRRCWHAPAGGHPTPDASEPVLHPLVHRRIPSPLATLYESRLRLETPHYLGDHRILGMAVLPSTGYIEMALMVGGGAPVEDLVITAPLSVPDGEERLVQIVLGEDRSLRVYGALPGAEPRWTLHASARLGSTSAGADAEWVSGSVETTVDPVSHYASLHASGLDFGPAFRGVVGVRRGADHARGEISTPGVIAAELPSYCFHPALLDACLQVVGEAAADRMEGRLYLPFGIDRVVVHRAPSTTLVTEARIRPVEGDVLVADLRVRDEAGRPIADLNGVRLKRVEAAVASGPDEAILEVQWRLEPRAIPNGSVSRDWLVVEGHSGLGRALAARLEAAGDRVTIVGPDVSADSLGERCRAWLAPDDRGPSGVVYLRGVDATLPANSRGMVATCRPGMEGLLTIIRALAERSDRRSSRLWVVTAQAQATGAEDLVDGLPQAALWGLARVAALEHPEIRCGRIDIDRAEPSPPSLDALVSEIRAVEADDEVALRGGERFVARLIPVDAAGQSIDRAVGAELTIAERGTFERLEWRPASRRAPGRDEIEIEVAASGLNFRDVLNALGAYPGDPGPLGSECAGRVVAVGADVPAFGVGDTVAAVTPGGGFRSFVTVPATLATRVPAALSLEDAAATPIAFLTALYGLERLARIRPGDRVLIHAAAGGVGLAAVQLAVRAGATVFATVGSERKRRRLASLGVSHIMSSRSLDFSREIMERTGGGVDIVLNSLAGEFIPASLSVLAPGGRFVELGKTGIWDPERVRRHRADVSYWTVYLGDLFQREPALIGSMLGRIFQDLESGALRRLPRRTFARGDAASAFRFMAQARHVGKLVLADPGAERLALRSDAAYLVTGGLGALGVEVTRWMVACGARHLVLLGRSVPADRTLAAVGELRAAGARVDLIAADVADRAAMARVVRDLAERGCILRGVVHAAGVVDDGVLTEQSWDRVASVLRPKAEGAWILHELTRELDLDFFVLFSSAAGTLGSAGQGGYAAANACLDALAHHRRALGLPAVSIGWGRWALGMAAAVDDRDRARWTRQGLRVIEIGRGLEILGRVLRGPQAHVMVSPTDWETYAAQTGTSCGLLSELTGRRASVAADARENSEPALLTRLNETPPAGRRRLLLGHVQAEAAKVLALEGSRAIGVSQGLRDLGLDSLMAVELRNRLQASVGRPLPSTLAFDHPTVEAIADFLGEVLEVEEPGTQNGAEPPSADLSEATADVESMSDEEAEALLIQELSEIDARKGERR